MITWLMRYAARIPLGHPRIAIAVSVALTVVAMLFVPRLHVSTDRNILSGTDNPEFQRRERVSEMFGTSLVAVVVLSAPTLEDVQRASDELAEALSGHADQVRDVFYRADIGFFERHALLFTPADHLEDLLESLRSGRVGVEVLEESDDLPSLVEMVAGHLEEQTVPEGVDEKDVDEVLGYFGKLLDDFRVWFEDPSVAQLGIIRRLWKGGASMAGGPDEGYLTDRDRKAPRLAVLFVQPRQDSGEMDVVAPLTDMIRAEAARVTARHDGCRAVVTGMPALATDELRLVTRDCLIAGFAAGMGVLLVFVFAFRSLRTAVFLVLPLGVGLVWSAGFTGLVYGHLTLITAYFAAVLFGLGVAFTLHIVARFHEALRDGCDKREALEISLTRAGPGVVVGGATTVLAFLAIVFSDFKGFAEMGVISGAGVAFVLVANLTLLPAALLLWHPGRSAAARQKAGGAFWENLGRSRVAVPCLALAAFIAGAFLASDIGFDYAVESMLPQGSEAVEGMRLLDDRTDYSSVYSIAVADSPERAEELRAGFEALPTVARAESITMAVPLGQEEKKAILRRVGDDVRRTVREASEHVDAARQRLGDTTAAEVSQALGEFADTMQDIAFDAKKAGRREAPMLSVISDKARAAAEAAAGASDERARSLERIVFTSLSRGLRVLDFGLTDEGFGADDLPVEIRRRYVSEDGGSFAVIAFPSGDLGKREFFYRHVDELLSVDPGTTGHPVTHRAFTDMVHDGFVDAVVLAATAVVLLILLDLRRPQGLILAIAPVIVGAGWTALALYLSGIKANYANLMALPILIGTGVDYGVHLAHRARQEGSVRVAARTTGKAIALSGVTTLIGFGSLILGNHWGVRSVGLVLVIGIFSSLVVALVVLPGLFGERPSREPDKAR